MVEPGDPPPHRTTPDPHQYEYARRATAASLALLIAAFSALPTRAQAEDARSAESDLELAREQWRGHVRETKRRVQQEAAQRRLEGPHSRAEPSQEELARHAS